MTYNLSPRKPLTKAQRPFFLLAHDCRCWWCGEPISDDQWDDEHIMARELGGSDDLSNRAPIHRKVCHPEKTAQDRALIARSNRVRRKAGLDPDNRKPRPKMRGRGFSDGHRPLRSGNTFRDRNG